MLSKKNKQYNASRCLALGCGLPIGKTIRLGFTHLSAFLPYPTQLTWPLRVFPPQLGSWSFRVFPQFDGVACLYAFWLFFESLKKNYEKKKV